MAFSGWLVLSWKQRAEEPKKKKENLAVVDQSSDHSGAVAAEVVV